MCVYIAMGTFSLLLFLLFNSNLISVLSVADIWVVLAVFAEGGPREGELSCAELLMRFVGSGWRGRGVECREVDGRDGKRRGVRERKRCMCV